MAATAVEARSADAFRDVFAPQDETEAALQALTYADGLCAYFGAHLSGLMIGLVPYYPMSLSGPSPEGWMQAQQQANEEASASEQRLRAIYATLTSSNDLKRVDAFEQEAARFHARRARVADLTIMGWTQSELVDSERAVFEACLFESAARCSSFPRAMCFAPRRSGRSSRGTARARRRAPCARPCRCCAAPSSRASSRSISEESDNGGYEDTVAQLARHLERHQTSVETKRAHGGAARGREHAGRRGRAIRRRTHRARRLCLCAGGGMGYGAGTRSALAHVRVPMLFAN